MSTLRNIIRTPELRNKILFTLGIFAVYRLGAAAIALGAQALRSNDLRTLVRPHLRQLASATGDSSAACSFANTKRSMSFAGHDSSFTSGGSRWTGGSSTPRCSASVPVATPGT